LEYTADDLSVMVHHYPVDGSQITVMKYDGDDWNTVVDSRFICDSFWEAMFDALFQSGLNSEHAMWQLDEWNIQHPNDDDEEY
jgi:hypothetical protein